MIAIKVLTLCCLLDLVPALHRAELDFRHGGGSGVVAEAEWPWHRRHRGRKGAKEEAAEGANRGHEGAKDEATEVALDKEVLSDEGQTRETGKTPLEQRHAEESEAERRSRIIEDKSRRLAGEEARAKHMAQMAAERAEEVKHISQVKEGRRQDVKESIARAEKRLQEKAREADAEDERREAKLAAQAREADRRAKRIDEKNAALERRIARVHQRRDEAKESEARAKQRATQKAADQKRHEEAQKQRAAQKAADQKRYEEAREARSLNKTREALHQEVIANRKAARQPDFFVKRSQDPLAELKQKLSLEDVIKGFDAAVRSDVFTLRVSGAYDSMLDAAASYAFRAQKNLAAFSETAANASDEELAPLLAGFMQESARLLASHQRATGSIKRSVQSAMPAGLLKALDPVAELVAPRPLPASLSAAGLGAAPLREACGRFALAMEDMSPLYDSVHKVRRALGAASKAALTPPRTVSERGSSAMRSLLEVGYIEAAALSKAAQDIIAKVGPVVEERCQKSLEKRKRRH